MSDSKHQEAIARFKAAFGIAQGAIDELRQQAELRRALGHGRPADTLDATRMELEESLDSATKTKHVEAVARQARATLDASTSEGVLRALDVLLNRIGKRVEDIKSDKKKHELDAWHKKLLVAHGKMDSGTPKPEIEDVEASATELLNEVLKAVPGNKKEIKNESNSIYKDMLQARYKMQDARSSPSERLGQLGGFLRNALNAQIKMLDNDETGDAIRKQHGTLLDAYSATFDKGDKRTKQDVDDLERQVMALLDDVAKARDKKPQALRQLYETTLMNRFDINATVELDKLYRVLSMVPPEHIAHSSLSEVEIGELDVESIGDYSRMANRIRINMVKITKHPKLEYTYESNGRTVKQKLDTFNAATLHEVGHSIDDRAGVMANPADESYGGWKTDETADTVADAYLKALEGKFKAGEATNFKELLKDAIKSALDGQECKKPEDVPRNIWKITENMLDTCRKLAADKKPWKTALPVGERVFHKDNNSWLSYSLKAREAFTVRDYQWRSPVEWFAELYAVSWVAKTPHTGLPTPVAKFMYKDPQ